MEIPEHIKFLVLKWRKGKLTDTEQKELDEWYNTPLPEMLYLDGADEEKVRLGMFEKIETEIGHSSEAPVRKIQSWIKVAAAVLLFLGIGLIYRNQRVSTENTSLVQQVQSNDLIKRIILPDSSIVWLKKNSTLSYPSKFNPSSREINLQGEALFEIAHHKKWPFKIHSGHYVTTVLGTSFNLKTGNKDEEFVISVLTGKVRVVRESPDQESGIYFVAANQSFHAEVGKVEKLASAKPDEQLPELIKGTQYDMNFSRTPFPEIIRRFEMKFGVELEGYTGEYDACEITADLTNLPLEKSLQLICLSMNATYKISNDKIKLTGGGCF